MKRLLPLLLGLLLSGCSTTITNLTPSKQTRNSTGLYPFEVLFHSNQKTLRKETLQPCVVVDLEAYPMQPAPVLKDRWETLVPVPADKKFINYRFKFDYQYVSVPQRRSGSILSAPYQLEIVDK
ncbi:MAG: hypothetical protein HY735_33835 [Verrucomicrobia bacterium]|nr:hypothetical protein [Verrucomicrobiota bacterium]